MWVGVGGEPEAMENDKKGFQPGRKIIQMCVS